jgi:hypothetical protein
MAIPDGRACLDHFSFPTRLADWIEAWFEDRRMRSLAQIFDGRSRRVAEAKLFALTLFPAPEGFARWTRLLEEKVVELHIVERASDNTIGGR